MKKLVVFLLVFGLLLTGALCITSDNLTQDIKDSDFDFFGDEDLSQSGTTTTDGGGGSGGGPAPG